MLLCWSHFPTSWDYVQLVQVFKWNVDSCLQYLGDQEEPMKPYEYEYTTDHFGKSFLHQLTSQLMYQNRCWRHQLLFWFSVVTVESSKEYKFVFSLKVFKSI